MSETSSRKSVLLYYAALGMVCLHFALAYTRQLPLAFDYHAYAVGAVADPFQTRILMSLIFKWALGWKFLASLSHGLAQPYNDPIYLLMLPIVAGSMFIATEAVRRASNRLGVSEEITRWGAFCVPLMAYFNFLLISEIRYQTPYDVPQVAVFAVCLAAALSRNRLLFYSVFLLGTLNRETTCFLIPLFGILEWERLGAKLSPRHWRLFAELALQAALWIPLRYFSAHFYAQHPTYALLLWRKNISFCLNPLHWPTLTSVFAFLWILYIVQFRRIGHRGLQACAILLPVWFALMFVVGDYLEIRIHSEWISYIAICVILIAANLLKSNAGLSTGEPN